MRLGQMLERGKTPLLLLLPVENPKLFGTKAISLISIAQPES